MIEPKSTSDDLIGQKDYIFIATGPKLSLSPNNNTFIWQSHVTIINQNFLKAEKNNLTFQTAEPKDHHLLATEANDGKDSHFYKTDGTHAIK